MDFYWTDSESQFQLGRRPFGLSGDGFPEPANSRGEATRVFDAGMRPMDKKFLTQEEVVAYFDVAADDLARLVESGALKALPDRTDTKYRKSDLEALIAAGELVAGPNFVPDAITSPAEETPSGELAAAAPPAGANVLGDDDFTLSPPGLGGSDSDIMLLGTDFDLAVAEERLVPQRAPSGTGSPSGIAARSGIRSTPSPSTIARSAALSPAPVAPADDAHVLDAGAESLTPAMRGSDSDILLIGTDFNLPSVTEEASPVEPAPTEIAQKAAPESAPSGGISSESGAASNLPAIDGVPALDHAPADEARSTESLMGPESVLDDEHSGEVRVELDTAIGGDALALPPHQAYSFEPATESPAVPEPASARAETETFNGAEDVNATSPAVEVQSPAAALGLGSMPAFDAAFSGPSGREPHLASENSIAAASEAPLTTEVPASPAPASDSSQDELLVSDSPPREIGLEQILSTDETRYELPVSAQEFLAPEAVEGSAFAVPEELLPTATDTALGLPPAVAAPSDAVTVDPTTVESASAVESAAAAPGPDQTSGGATLATEAPMLNELRGLTATDDLSPGSTSELAKFADQITAGNDSHLYGANDVRLHGEVLDPTAPSSMSPDASNLETASSSVIDLQRASTTELARLANEISQPADPTASISTIDLSGAQASEVPLLESLRRRTPGGPADDLSQASLSALADLADDFVAPTKESDTAFDVEVPREATPATVAAEVPDANVGDLNWDVPAGKTEFLASGDAAGASLLPAAETGANVNLEGTGQGMGQGAKSLLPATTSEFLREFEDAPQALPMSKSGREDLSAATSSELARLAADFVPQDSFFTPGAPDARIGAGPDSAAPVAAESPAGSSGAHDIDWKGAESDLLAESSGVQKRSPLDLAVDPIGMGADPAAADTPAPQSQDIGAMSAFAALSEFGGGAPSGIGSPSGVGSAIRGSSHRADSAVQLVRGIDDIVLEPAVSTPLVSGPSDAFDLSRASDPGAGHTAINRAPGAASGVLVTGADFDQVPHNADTQIVSRGQSSPAAPITPVAGVTITGAGFDLADGADAGTTPTTIVSRPVPVAQTGADSPRYTRSMAAEDVELVRRAPGGSDSDIMLMGSDFDLGHMPSGTPSAAVAGPSDVRQAPDSDELDVRASEFGQIGQGSRSVEKSGILLDLDATGQPSQVSGVRARRPEGPGDLGHSDILSAISGAPSGAAPSVRRDRSADDLSLKAGDSNVHLEWDDAELDVGPSQLAPSRASQGGEPISRAGDSDVSLKSRPSGVEPPQSAEIGENDVEWFGDVEPGDAQAPATEQLDVVDFDEESAKPANAAAKRKGQLPKSNEVEDLEITQELAEGLVGSDDDLEMLDTTELDASADFASEELDVTQPLSKIPGKGKGAKRAAADLDETAAVSFDELDSTSEAEEEDESSSVAELSDASQELAESESSAEQPVAAKPKVKRVFRSLGAGTASAAGVGALVLALNFLVLLEGTLTMFSGAEPSAITNTVVKIFSGIYNP